MKYIIVCGGVMSGIGKGVTVASLGRLLKFYGFSVTCIKIDPYLNIDAGTMSPYEHGECFVLDDGTECDLDLGTYERFLNIKLTGKHNLTSGKIYQTVLKKERKGDYLGQTIQIVPHITDEIQNWIRQTAQIKVDPTRDDISDVCIVEVGGTVGDMEGAPFIEAIRQMKSEHELFIVHVVYLPYLASTGELKTKPAQRSVMELRKLGLTPDMLCIRSKQNLTKSVKQKMGNFCNINKTQIIECPDINNIYEIPLHYLNLGIVLLFVNKLHLPSDILGGCFRLKKGHIKNKQTNKFLTITEFNKKTTFDIHIKQWTHYINHFKTFNTNNISIGIIGKYTHLKDSYLSLNYAIKHAAAHLNIPTNINWIEATDDLDIEKTLLNVHAVIIPGGFGKRGTETMIKTANYARINHIPLLGICLGMHVMAIEAARNLLGYQNATSKEFDKHGPFVIVETTESCLSSGKGGTMRRGLLETRINPNSTICMKAYNTDIIKERHRHRYELAHTCLKKLTKQGFILSYDAHGKNVDLFELHNHPFYIGCQYHPEFLTHHDKPHPLFTELLLSAKIETI